MLTQSATATGAFGVDLAARLALKSCLHEKTLRPLTFVPRRAGACTIETLSVPSAAVSKHAHAASLRQNTGHLVSDAAWPWVSASLES